MIFFYNLWTGAIPEISNDWIVRLLKHTFTGVNDKEWSIIDVTHL